MLHHVKFNITKMEYKHNIELITGSFLSNGA